MSIPQPPHEATPPAGWYPTGENGPDGQPAERWWDGSQWSAVIRPLGSGASVPPRGSRTRTLIAAGVIVALVGGGVATYLALQNSGSTDTASSGPQPTPTTVPSPGGGNGNGNGGLGGGGGNGGLGNPANPGASPSPMPTVTGGSGQTVSDPIDGLTIPVPSGWTATAGSATGEGTWPALGTGPYTCPTGLTQSNGSSAGSAATCTRGGMNFGTASGTTAQSLATSSIATLAKNNYGNLSSHNVVNQGAITVAGRAGYQITWSVVPNYSGPSGTVEVIAVPVPGHSTFFTLIDIGLDQTSQAPSLSSVNTQIVANITGSGGSGAGAGA